MHSLAKDQKAINAFALDEEEEAGPSNTPAKKITKETTGNSNNKSDIASQIQEATSKFTRLNQVSNSSSSSADSTATTINEAPTMSAGGVETEKNPPVSETISRRDRLSTSAQDDFTLEVMKEHFIAIDSTRLIELPGSIYIKSLLRQQLDRKGLTSELYKIIVDKGLNKPAKDGKPQFFFDLHDIILIFLYRGTNFLKIATNVSKDIKPRIEQLAVTYKLTRDKSKSLGSCDPTVTRIAELFPLRMACVWLNPDKQNRPPVRYYSNLTSEEMDLIYYYRCPAIPYLCAYVEDGRRKTQKYDFIMQAHLIIMSDFDMLLNEYKGDQKVKSYTPNVSNIRTIMNYKINAVDYVPTLAEKNQKLRQFGFINDNGDVTISNKEPIQKVLNKIIDHVEGMRGNIFQSGSQTLGSLRFIF